MGILFRIVTAIFASVGLLAILLTGVVLFTVLNLDSFDSSQPQGPDQMYLALDLDQAFTEGPPQNGLNRLRLNSQNSVHDIVTALKQAKNDPRVLGVFATVSSSTLGIAQIQEIRAAVNNFRQSGKPTILFAETIGEGRNGTGAYYLAAAFEDIWLQPSGEISTTGLLIEQPFLRGLLDKIGVYPSFLQRKEFKSAAESFTNSVMSEANKEALETLQTSLFDQILGDISTDRNLSLDRLRSLVNNSPLLSAEAVEGGLVDNIGYRDKLEEAIDKDIGTRNQVTVERYLSFALPEDAPEPQKSIAIIYGAGQIVRGKTDNSPFVSSENIGSHNLSESIRNAAGNEEIAAIVLRVDSPGGSYVASDTIWHEILLAKKKGKPIIASMGNVAASGGYYISMAADHIVAEPGTITGSIGVITGKFVLEEAFEKLNINWETLKSGRNADIFSATSDFSNHAIVRMNRNLDFIYDDFTSKAAQGRGMSKEKLELLARGRVWTGSDAHKIGLIDQLGGLDDAIDYAKVAVGLESDDPVWLVPFPPPKDPLEAIIELLDQGALPLGMGVIMEYSFKLGNWIQPLLDVGRIYSSGSGVLYMDPIRVR